MNLIEKLKNYVLKNCSKMLSFICFIVVLAPIVMIGVFTIILIYKTQNYIFLLILLLYPLALGLYDWYINEVFYTITDKSREYDDLIYANKTEEKKNELNKF